jgi:hypothetical protein
MDDPFLRDLRDLFAMHAPVIGPDLGKGLMNEDPPQWPKDQTIDGIRKYNKAVVFYQAKCAAAWAYAYADAMMEARKMKPKPTGHQHQWNEPMKDFTSGNWRRSCRTCGAVDVGERFT